MTDARRQIGVVLVIVLLVAVVPATALVGATTSASSSQPTPDGSDGGPLVSPGDGASPVSQGDGPAELSAVASPEHEPVASPGVEPVASPELSAVASPGVEPAPGSDVDSTTRSARERPASTTRSTKVKSAAIERRRLLPHDDEQETPDTAEEFLDALQALAGLPAYQEYTEFETIREVGVSTVQVGTFDQETEREATAIYELLVSFDQAFQHAENGEDEASLEAAERAADRVDDLQSMGASYAVLADLALQRFFGNRANELFERAEATDRTTERLDRLELASRAIEQTDQTDAYSRITTEIEELSVELERDRERINESIEDGTAFVEGCRECTTPRGALGEAGFGVFGAYASSLQRSSELDTTAELAAGHGLTERQERIEEVDADVTERQEALAVASVSLFVAALSVLAVLAAALAVRIVRWHQDALESQTGNDVFAEEIRDA